MENLFEFENSKYNNIQFENFNQWSRPKTVDEYDDGIHFLSFKNVHNYHDTWKEKFKDNKKETFEKYLLDPFWSLFLRRYRIIIQKDESKVRIKFYYYSKEKVVGRKFYRIHTNLTYFTYNYKTNSLYRGKFTNYHKKRKFTKSVSRATPSHQPLSSIRTMITSTINECLYHGTGIINQYDYANNIFNIFLNSIPGIENYNHIENTDNRFYKLMYDRYDVKLPNNWTNLVFVYPQPKMKLIRKNKNKYIDSLMSLHNLKGDKIRKVLHEVKHFNPNNLPIVFSWFGETFIQQQSNEFLKKLFEFNYYFDSIDNNFNIFSKQEKKNIFEIFNLVLDLQIGTPTFFDHIRFYKSVKRFEPIKWKSKDYESFQQEHLDWTDRNDFYTKGEYKRIYDRKLYEELEIPIRDKDNNPYYPILLSSSKEYNEESFTQSNCVKGYVTKASSLVISLRKGSKDSKERATIEFSIVKSNHIILLQRIQTLGRFNQKLDESWDVPIAVLDASIRTIFNNDKMELPSIEVKCGHKTFTANGVFNKKNFRLFYNVNKYDDSSLYLSWDRDIDIVNGSFINNLIPIQINDLNDGDFPI